MLKERERALRLAVRGPVVLRYLGELSLVLGVTALVPVLAAVAFGELDLIGPYAVASLLFLAGAAVARRWPAPEGLQRNEALVVTAGVFTLSPLVLSGPLVFQGIAWPDALFEAISGVTTTGLSTLEAIEARSRTFLLARAWMQWVGGLGFVVLFLAITLEPGIATRRLGSPSLETAEVPGSMRYHARRVLRVYLALSAAAVALLLALGASFFDALVHGLAGVSTGGFAPRDQSLAGLGLPLQAGILATALLGALPLLLYAELFGRRWRRVLGDPELRLMLLLSAAGALLLWIFARSSGDERGAADLALLFVSAQTTAGFAPTPVEGLSAAAIGLLLFAMITGGCLGSTAGGFKLLRLLLVLRLVQWLVTETHLPRGAVAGPTLSGQRLESPELLRAAALVLLYLGVVCGSWLPFLAYGYEPLAALFEVVSATGTVGLSVGITRPELEPLLKGILCADMLLGRLEIFALLVTLSPTTWLGRGRS